MREKAAYEPIGFLVAQTGVPSGSCETPQAKACATLSHHEDSSTFGSWWDRPPGLLIWGLRPTKGNENWVFAICLFSMAWTGFSTLSLPISAACLEVS